MATIDMPNPESYHDIQNKSTALKPVVKNKATVNRSLKEKVHGALFADNLDEVKQELKDGLYKKAKVEIKRFVYDAIMVSLQRIFDVDGVGSKNSITDYSGMYQNSVLAPSEPAVETKTNYDYNNIRYVTRSDAEDVLRELRERCSKYGRARVSEMFELAGMSAPWTMEHYGWKNLDNAYVVRDGSGFRIITGKAVALGEI